MRDYHKIKEAVDQRILFLDGAMGTMIQKHPLSEEDFRGNKYANWASSLKGNNDLLSITQPEIISGIHLAFLEAGADIIETNTFNANAISMDDYGMKSEVVAINLAAAKIAREAADRYTEMTPDKPRFVAGSIGPTSKTASLSPDVNQPEYRAVSFDDLVESYTEQTKALIEGGVDILLVETVFDTLNCKAALFAIMEIKNDLNIDIPIMVSGTITDASGRTLSGQTTEAFWNSISHANLFSVGLNCALGAEQMRPYVKELSRVAWVNVSCHPNAGLPNEFGEYDQTPDEMAAILREFAESGFTNIIGGCCGTSPEHLRAIVEIAKDLPKREVPVIAS